MQRTILITGSTDGIGRAAARALVTRGHRVLVHGRSADKVHRAETELAALSSGKSVTGYVADLSERDQVEALARNIIDRIGSIDVLINNAGVFIVEDPIGADGLDIRFTVNTIAPYLLSKRLLPALGASGRIVSLSSAAQSSVDLDAMAGGAPMDDGEAYAQSKLALTMWSRWLAHEEGPNGPVVVSVNPGSMLGTKMVRDAYGVKGGDVRTGADLLVRAALSDGFANSSGAYFDGDTGRFAAPHPDALDDGKCAALVERIEAILQARDS